MDYHKLFNGTENILILDAFTKADSVVNDPSNRNILCSISGGADSDVMLDIIHTVDKDNKVHYVWFDTGLEYQATKDHLKYLEARYNITIEREKAIKPIPISCREYGQPFLSKYVSEMIGRLQRHGFKWEDRPYEELLEEYPNCISAIKWWCNNKKPAKATDTGKSRFDINYIKGLKEFLTENPPWFKISSNCCTYAKKNVAKDYVKSHSIDLQILGLRKAEGGIRATAYKSCYTQKESDVSQYRPLFWFTNDVKREYEDKFFIEHSRCYTEYGFERTGCCCCPYGGKNLEAEHNVTEEFEPNLYKAVSNVFKDSYEYTRMFYEFRKNMKEKNKDGNTRY